MLLNTAGVALQPYMSYYGPDNMGMSPACAADFNGDGHIDVAVASGVQMYGGTYGGHLIIFFNVGDGTGTFHPYTSVMDHMPTLVTAADIDGDGSVDLVTTATSSGQTETYVHVLINKADGTGTFEDYAPYPLQSDVGVLTSLVAADFTGDGYPDVAVGTDSSSVAILINEGDGTGVLGPYTTYFVGTIPGSMVAADLDGDHFIDLAMAPRSSNGQHTFETNFVIFLLNEGDGSGMFKEYTYAYSQRPIAVAAADVDGDGAIDVLTADHYYYDNYPHSPS